MQNPDPQTTKLEKWVWAVVGAMLGMAMTFIYCAFKLYELRMSL